MQNGIEVAKTIKLPEADTWIEIQKTQLSRNPKTKTQKFVEKICLLNCKNDLKGLNYNRYGTKGHRIFPISDVFCDNFLLSTPTQMEYKKNKLVGYYNRRIHAVLTKHNQTSFIKAVKISQERQYYKISCNSVPLDNVIQIIQDPEFRESDILLADIDITQDFAGCFNKEEVMEAMAQTGEFHIQGEEYQGEENTILDNSHNVGDNCLTYKGDCNGEIRSKIYNKFAQEVESDSVRENFGHHLYGWCHGGGIYKDTVKKALPYGLLRVETTYYGRIPTRREMEYTITEWTRRLKPELCYSTPIEKQWICVAEKIDRNLVVKCGNLIAVCLWINSLTGKIGGYIKETEDENDFRWMALELTFNKPLDIIFMELDGEYIRLATNSYNKLTDKNTEAQLVSRKYIYQCGDANPADFGLVQNNGVELFVNKKMCNKKTKPRFTLEEIEPIVILAMDKKLVAKEELVKLKQEQKVIKDRVKELTKQRKEAEKANKKDKEKLESIYNACFRSQISNMVYNSYKGQRLLICGAMKRDTKYGPTFVLVDGNGKGWWADQESKKYLSSIMDTTTYKSRTTILQRYILTITGFTYTKARHSCVLTKITPVEQEKKEAQKIQEQIDIINQPLPLIDKVGAPKDYQKLESLEIGDVLTVLSYGKLLMRGVERTVISTDKGDYIDNHWLQQEYKKMDTMYKHKIICIGDKTTPQKHKAKTVRIINSI